jgi:hypothetical protein
MKRRKKRAGGARGGRKYKGARYVLKGKKRLYGAAAAAYAKSRGHGRSKKRTKTRRSR